MPTAFTVAAEARVNVPPLGRTPHGAVQDVPGIMPSTGVEPSVVYQMLVLPWGTAWVLLV